MATEILRPHDILISVAPQIRHNYRRLQSNSNSKSKSKPPFRKSSPKPPTADAAAAAAAAKFLKNRKTKLEELYAGSGFSISPAPSSVPLPSFSVVRREASLPSPLSSPSPSPLLEKQAVDYVATRDLRRILRLL